MFTIFLGNRHFSGWSMRANIAIREKQVEYREVPIDMDWPDHVRADGVLDVGDWTGDWCRAGCYCLTEDLTGLDPTGRLAGSLVEVMPRVPVLVHDESGAVASDILAIAELLDEVAPDSGTRLIGDSVGRRAQIRSFAGNVYVDFQPIVESASYGLSLWDETPAQMPTEAAECAVLIERTIGSLLTRSSAPWLFGEFSLADVMMTTFLQELRGWDHQYSDHTVAAYADRLLTRDSVAGHLAEARLPYDRILSFEPGTAPWIMAHYRYNPELELIHDWQRKVAYRVQNPTMKAVVELAHEGCDREQIAAQIARRFGAEVDTVRDDVDRVLHELRPIAGAVR